jgi:hypothetical protein
MGTLHCNIRLTDPELTIKVEDLTIDYDRRVVLDRVLTYDDGEVSIDLTGAGTISAFYLHTTSPITLKKADASTQVVDTDILILSDVDISSIQNLDEDNDAAVEIYAYGSASA